MQSQHLSESPIWIPQSDLVHSLDGKTLLLCEQDGREYVVQLAIIQAPPNGPEGGKVAIRVWQTDRGSVPFEEKKRSAQVPTKVYSTWSAYLEESAVNQITEATEYCDFVLQLAD
jgi:hypothetical protein